VVLPKQVASQIESGKHLDEKTIAYAISAFKSVIGVPDLPGSSQDLASSVQSAMQASKML